SETKAVLGFFQDKVLAAARPLGQEGGLGKDVTLRAAVDAAESSIASEFAGQPIVEAAIRITLGVSYGYLGDTRLSVQQMARARKRRVDELGPNHPITLDSMAGLAWAYLNAGRTDEAIRLNEETLKLRKA